MAWKWTITKVDYAPGNQVVTIEMKIYRDTWSMVDKAIVRYFNFGSTADVSVAALTVLAQNEIDAYQSMKTAQTSLNALMGVEQTIV